MSLLFHLSGIAATIYVPDTHATIQAAINASSDGDTIIVRSGTYVENIDLMGKAITLKSETGPGRTTIDGNKAGSTVKIHSGEGSDTVLEGFTITNGTGHQSGPYIYGGGIYCMDSSPTITDNLITGNKIEDDGGGIYCAGSSTPIITKNVIKENIAERNGGAISCGYDTTALITFNVIMENKCDSYGGGIWCTRCSPTISNNLITGNYADYGEGGGIACHNGVSVVISGNVISRNESGRYGGGIYCWGTPAVIMDNIIAGNDSSTGGGIYCRYRSKAKIMNNLIMCNTASRGGGLSFLDDSTTIINNTITANSASGSGGGLYCDDSHPVVSNTILWDNSAPSGLEIYVESGSPTVTYSDVKGGWAGTGNIDSDPLFVDAALLDCHLTVNSPCKDSGDSSAVPPTLLNDFEGDSRIADGNVDMGCDEFHTHLYSLGSVEPGRWISIRVIGSPGEPVVLVLGSGIQDPPYQTSYGYFHLQLPIVSQYPLGAVSPDGFLSLNCTIPGSWQPGEEYPYQALVGALVPGSELSNLMVLTVE